MAKDQAAVQFTLYKTKNSDALLVTEPGVIHVASITLPLPPDFSRSKSWRTRARCEYSIKVALRFGGTSLRMTASDVQTGQKVECSVRYEQD